MEIDILGTKYTIEVHGNADPRLDDSDGYFDHTTKQIVVSDMVPEPDSVQDLDVYQQQVIRHEIVHAFFRESGLGYCENEELVEWLAIQLPKLYKACKAAEAL